MRKREKQREKESFKTEMFDLINKGYLEQEWYFMNSLENRDLRFEIYYCWIMCLVLVTNACNNSTLIFCRE